MTISNSILGSMMKTKMGWLGERQRVLAQNIANADTPAYRAQDLQPLDFKRHLAGDFIKVRMVQTSDAHVQSPYQDNDDFRSMRSRRNYETAPMRNNVILEEQMMKLNSTSADFQLATTTYQQFKQLYSTAIRSGG